VYRRRKEPGGIVARVAKSHVRVGTFQYAAAHVGVEGVKALVAHMIARSYPDVSDALGLLASVISRQARLIAQWMCVGFIHGVMNTDNMAISGETIDFGPCAFMDAFHPKKVFSSIDEHGRYAWDQQPGIALWNLTRFAESLLDMLHEDRDHAVEIAKAELAQFYPQFEEAFETGMLAKLGIRSRSADDGAFIADMLRVLMDEKLDYTVFFRELTRGGVISDQAEGIWRGRLSGAAPDVVLMQASNPVYIARNHQVELALKEAEDGNLVRLHTLLSLLKTPFTEQPNMAGFEAPPLPEEEVTQTFCGT
jgi:serine/tyrosine/threonine adenylyltransferase